MGADDIDGCSADGTGSIPIELSQSLYTEVADENSIT
jgi:hypothetical protein